MSSLDLFIFDHFSLVAILLAVVGIGGGGLYEYHVKERRKKGKKTIFFVSLFVYAVFSFIAIFAPAYLFVNGKNISRRLPLNDTKEILLKITNMDNSKKRAIGEIGFSFTRNWLTGEGYFLPISPIFLKKFDLLLSGNLSVPVDTDEIPPFKYAKIKDIRTHQCPKYGLDIDKEIRLVRTDGKIDESEYKYLKFLSSECILIKNIAKKKKKVSA